MNNKKNGLDEMQKQKRNSIGNQMFMLMYWLLFLNSGLHGAGITWLLYPADVMVIITVCMGIYLVRLIIFNAYLPPKAYNRKTAVSLIMAIGFTVTLVISAINLFGQSAKQVAESSDNNLTVIVMIISGLGLLATLIVAAIKRTNNKDKED